MPHKFNRLRIIDWKKSMVFFFLWGIDDFFVELCSSIITIDEQIKGEKYIYLRCKYVELR